MLLKQDRFLKGRSLERANFEVAVVLIVGDNDAAGRTG
jgi:hypothetical protein